APEYFANYLREYWLGDKWVKMWSLVYRKDLSIYKESDTNMLIEAYHRVLNTKFLCGKRNRRLDDLIAILTSDCVEHY
ncbi:hypothetical protein PENSPDRAFT_595783, partial [Peniophora sp. CONT]